MRYMIDYPGRITDENREAVIEKLAALTKEDLTAEKQPIAIEHDGKTYTGLVYESMKTRTFKVNSVEAKPAPAAKVATAKKAAPVKKAAPKESAAKRKGK